MCTDLNAAVVQKSIIKINQVCDALEARFMLFFFHKVRLKIIKKCALIFFVGRKNTEGRVNLCHAKLSTFYLAEIMYLKLIEHVLHVVVARYNWPHSFSCAARCGKRQISCHNKRYIQSRPRTGEVQTRHEY